MPNYMFAQLDEIEPVKCPCGESRRAFVDPNNPTSTLHLLQVREDAQAHYHKKLTETYLVLEGEGHIELDDEFVAVRPFSAVLIKPGCRHRAVGNMRIVVMPTPAFDPNDEWTD